LQAIQASRIDTSKPVTEPRFQGNQLAAEEERLKEVIQSLELQHQRRLEQREQLVLRSPIAGQIVTWDIERLLRSRPLQRGQRLMSVAASDGDWLLELRVADADVGHVLAAWHAAGRTLPVSYRIVGAPAQKHHAVLMEVADWTEVSDEQRRSVRMTAKTDDIGGPSVRPGATVVAEIELGTRSRAYVWLRDVWEFVRVHVWF
jgi:hypothetical protein